MKFAKPSTNAATSGSTSAPPDVEACIATLESLGLESDTLAMCAAELYCFAEENGDNEADQQAMFVPIHCCDGDLSSDEDEADLLAWQQRGMAKPIDGAAPKPLGIEGELI
jgi:hypothetical protein